MLWALSAGVAAAISLTAFYMALARGEMGVSAAISGLLAAAIPAVVSAFLEGVPAPLTLAGFLLAGAAIWIIAAGPSPENVEASHTRGTLALALVGGLGFGFYFVSLKFANPLGVVEPMALARAASLVTCSALLVITTTIPSPVSPHPRTRVSSTARRPWLSRPAILWALGVALLDTGGNLLFLAATRRGRLDVASVLASLYPAGTILLAAWQLHERPTRRQITGMLLALAAVIMITL
jgi:drug/metabolite transporter (DMT)-like permease